jgi:hypothetical protein
MENGSISSLRRVLIELPEGCDRFGQKPFFSGGEGYGDISANIATIRIREPTGKYTPLSLTTVFQIPISQSVSRFATCDPSGVWARTGHLVLDGFLALPAPNTHGRRSLGARRIDLFKGRPSAILRQRSNPFFVRRQTCLDVGALRKGISDRHCEVMEWLGLARSLGTGVGV